MRTVERYLLFAQILILVGIVTVFLLYNVSLVLVYHHYAFYVLINEHSLEIFPVKSLRRTRWLIKLEHYNAERYHCEYPKYRIVLAAAVAIWTERRGSWCVVFLHFIYNIIVC